MLRNYLTVAMRNLLRQKVCSFINITGLGISIASCLLIYLYIQHEWTYDRFHENADRIYLVRADYENWTVTPPILAPTLLDNFPDVEDALLVNEALVEFMGWDSGIGKTPQVLRPDSKDFGKTIVGVVKDFHFQPLHMPIQPSVFHLCAGRSLRYIFIRIAPNDLPGTIALLRDRWNRAMSNRPFVYSFLDEDVARTFRESERWGMIIQYATLFAIFIACLGAFGLTSLGVARRTKEIGIRKVLGASTSNIVLLLSKS